MINRKEKTKGSLEQRYYILRVYLKVGMSLSWIRMKKIWGVIVLKRTLALNKLQEVNYEM